MTSNESSDDFFNSFGGTPAQKSTSVRARKPPPPPRNGKTTSTTTTTTTTTAAAATGVKSASTSPNGIYTGSGRPVVSKKPATSTSSSRRMPTASAAAAASSSYLTGGGRSMTQQSAGTTSYYGQSAGTSATTTSRSPTLSSTPAPTIGTGFYNPSAGAAAAAPAPAAPQIGTGFYGSSSATPSTAAAPGSTSSWGYGGAAAPAPSTTQQQQTGISTSGSNPYLLSSGQSTQQQPPMASSGYASSTSAPAPLGNGFFQPQQHQQQAEQQEPYGFMSGPMDTNGGSAPSTFVPNAAASAADTKGVSSPTFVDFENEPPLLEELGINLQHIGAKTRAVVLPFQRFGGDMDAQVIQDADLAGPLVLALALGGELLLSGKIHFGYIYGFGLFGCLAMTLVLNLMSPKEAISTWTVTSILGYSLLPVNVLAAVKLLLVNLILNLQTLGRILAVLTVIWSTVAATRLLEQGCGMRDQRYLIAYPIGMLYSAFVLITIF